MDLRLLLVANLMLTIEIVRTITWGTVLYMNVVLKLFYTFLLPRLIEKMKYLVKQLHIEENLMKFSLIMRPWYGICMTRNQILNEGTTNCLLPYHVDCGPGKRAFPQRKF